MKRRYCDQCLKEIPVGTDYFKLSLQKHEDKRQVLVYVGDLCTKCWNKRDRWNYGKKK